MTQQSNSGTANNCYRTNLDAALAAAPCDGGGVATTRAPAVADVMGGIGEDSRSLVLTATLGLSFVVSLWRVADKNLTVRLISESGLGPSHDVRLPIDEIISAPGGVERLISQCKQAGGEWAAPVCLTLARAIAQEMVPRPTAGLVALVQTDFPPDVDLGRHTVLAAATIEAACRLAEKQVDRATKSHLCSDAVEPMTGLRSVRTAMTALAGLADGSLLEIHFHPHIAATPLPLPPGILVLVARTILARPVKRERMIDTRICTEMSHRLIVQSSGEAGRPKVDRLSAITPAEFVAHFRDVLPQKAPGRYLARFEALRGLNGDLAPDQVYKVRSRAEHHVYDSLRVRDFVAALNRARRTQTPDALTAAGDLMYASHWSHSQRCGIGGVEPDQFITCVKAEGPPHGLYGAKVTGGGGGGEMVVLMRDDPAAHAALARALAQAQSQSNRHIHTYRGGLAGAELATV
jgi:galactokinase